MRWGLERVLWGLVWLLMALLLLPLVWMLIESLFVAAEAGVEAYGVLGSPKLWQHFLNSLALAGVVALLTTLLGTFLGVVLSKTTLPFATLWGVVFLLPLLIPPYIIAFAWFELLGREVIVGFWGSAWVLFWVYLPIPMLLVWRFMQTIAPTLEESALLLSGWGGVLRHITLPLIAPAVWLGFWLVFILAFGEFSVANFLHYPTFPMESFTYFSAFYDAQRAVITLLPTMGLALLIWRRVNHEGGFAYWQIQPHIKKIPLSRSGRICLEGLLGLVALLVLTPLVMLILQSDVASWGVALDRGWMPLMRSLLFASMGATLLMILGFLAAYALFVGVAGGRYLVGVMLLGLMLPATVIGIGLSLFWNQPWSNWVYATPVIILLGYVGKYLFLTTKIAQVRLAQLPPSQMEAAQLLGASPAVVLWKIVRPLSHGTLGVMWLMGFIFTLRESTLTLLVYPAGEETLPLYILTQMANGKPALIAALSLIMVGVVLLPLGGYALYRSRG